MCEASLASLIQAEYKHDHNKITLYRDLEV